MEGYPAMHWPGTELAISRSRARRPNHYTTESTRLVRRAHVTSVVHGFGTSIYKFEFGIITFGVRFTFDRRPANHTMNVISLTHNAT